MAPPKKAKPKRKDRANSISSGTDKEQSERFKEAARSIGAVASSEQFGALFSQLVPEKKSRKR